MSDSQQPGADSVPPVPPAFDPTGPSSDVAPEASAEIEGSASLSDAPDAGTGAAPAHPAPASPPPPAPIVNPYVQTPTGTIPGSPNPYVTPTQLPVSQISNPFSAPAAAVFGQQQPPQPMGAPVPPPTYPTAPQPGPQFAAPMAPHPQMAGTPAAGPQVPAPAQPAVFPYPEYGPPPGAPGYAGYAPGVMPPPSTFNVLGLVALILGGLGLLIGIVPFVGVFGTILGFAGLIIGIVGLVVKNKTKGLAIAGTIVSGVALIASIAVSAWAFSMVSQPFSSGSDWDPDYEPEPWVAEDPGASPDSELGGTGPGSSTEPYALGETILIADENGQYWELVVEQPTLDATADVAAASDYNEVPPDGYQYVIVPITYTYLGEAAESAWLDFYLYVSGSDGNAYPDAFIYEYPDHVTDAEDLATGETATLVTMFLVTSDAVDGSLLKITHWNSDTIYVALD